MMFGMSYAVFSVLGKASISSVFTGSLIIQISGVHYMVTSTMSTTSTMTSDCGLYTKYLKDLTAGDVSLHHDRMLEFINDLTTQGWLLANFTWDYWYNNSYLVDKPAYIRDASIAQCKLLLTAMTRLEVFSPGVLENMRRQGILLAIVERLQSLNVSKSDTHFEFISR